MATYRLHRDQDLGAEFRRVAHDQLVRALAELDGDDLHHGVHQVRKRCKKLRALVRLLHATERGLSRRENAAFRDTARRISELRDVAALVEAHDALTIAVTTARPTDDAPAVPTDALAVVRDGLIARRDRSAAAADETAVVRRELHDAVERVATWQLPDLGFDLVAGGLLRTYRQGRRDLARVRADPTTEALHAWRKRVKDHRYQVRLLQDAWPRVLRARRRELHRLGELLGDDHDLAGLATVLAREPEAFGGTTAVAAVQAGVTARRRALQAEAVALGARVYAEPPDAFVARLAGYWAAATPTDQA